MRYNLQRGMVVNWANLGSQCTLSFDKNQLMGPSDIVQTRKSHTDSSANPDANGIQIPSGTDKKGIL